MADLLNSKLKFLQGTQADLDKFLAGTSTAKAENKGSFYLTNDTHRLYIQESDTSIVPVNEGVITVANVKALPTLAAAEEKKAYAGRFYYATEENILCVYSGKAWVQINANTNTTLAEDLAAVKVGAVSSNATTVTTSVKDTDENVATGSFTIKDSTNVNKIVVDSNAIDVQGEVYKIGVSEVSEGTATVKVTPTNNAANSSTVTIAAGDNVEIAANGENGIKISSSYSNTTNETLEATYDGFTAGGNGDLKITLTDSDNSPVEATVHLGKYYTEEEIDKKFRDLNGLKYIGTISSAEDIPSENVESGHMYLISAENVKFSDSLTAHKGDIVIATGTENDAGYLTTITWTYIPSGDDEEIDTTYHFSGAGLAHGVKLYNESASDAEGSFALSAGTAMILEDSVTESSDENAINQVVTVKHADVTHTTTPEDAKTTTDATSITYIDGVTVNAQGHVTNVSKHTAELRDTTYELSGATVEKDTNSNKVTVTDTLTDLLNEAEAGTSAFSLASDTLTLSASDTTVTADITWGSF